MVHSAGDFEACCNEKAEPAGFDLRVSCEDSGYSSVAASDSSLCARKVDKLAIVNVQSPEEKPPNDVPEGCHGIFYAGPEGWGLDLEEGKPCKEAAAGAQSLGPGGKKNLGMHLTSKDPAVAELLKRLSEKKKD